MLRIRSFVLDGIALLGIAIGVAVGVGGFVPGLSVRLERMVLAVEPLDVEITGSISRASSQPQVEPTQKNLRPR